MKEHTYTFRLSCFTKVSIVLIVALAAILSGPTSNYAAAPTLPSVSVSGVTATSPVLRSTAEIDVSATVTATFDSGSVGSSTNYTNGCNSGNNYCGSGASTVRSKKVVTTTAVTVSNQTVTATADDFRLSPVVGTLSGAAFSAILATPASGTDGFQAVTVAANVSEVVTTCITTDTSYWTASNGGGTQVGSTTTVGPTCDAGTTKTGSGSNTGKYVLDINAPTLTLHPAQSQPDVLQGEDKVIHNELIAGSANTPYTLVDTIYGPAGPGQYTNSANGGGTFGPGNDGIAPKEPDPVAVHVACDAPIGAYTANAVANTVDLGLNPFSQISSVDVAGPGGGNSGGSAQDTFNVGPGLFLEDQTLVVSELPPSGDYAPMTCFTANTSGRKVSTFPGSLHITSTVNTTGPCAGFGSISATVVSLTLPVGFSFDTTGASPAAHVFIVPAAPGFDLHYPGPETSIPKSAITKSLDGQTLNVDLTSLGDIPASDTIYVRAHAVFTGGAVPADGTPYVFGTSTTSQLPGIGITTNSSTQTVTKSSSCVNGNLPL